MPLKGQGAHIFHSRFERSRVAGRLSANMAGHITRRVRVHSSLVPTAEKLIPISSHDRAFL